MNDYLTVRPRSGEATSWADCMSSNPKFEPSRVERKPVKAFCIDCKTSASLKFFDRLYKIGSTKRGILILNPIDGWLCPHCNHAIMHSCHYEKVKTIE